MDEALREAVRVSERVLDHQLESLLAERSDLGRLMRLGVAALAGTLVGTGLLVQAGMAFSQLSALLLATGILLMTVATAIAGVAAPPSEVSVGPKVRDLYRNMGSAISTLRDLHFALLDQATIAERHNGIGLEKAAARRVRAGFLLSSGGACVLAALAYVVWGAIHG